MAKIFKIVCDECDWKGTTDEQLTSTNRHNTADTFYHCPACKDVKCFTVACDEPGCWLAVSCGTPTPTGYRSTCHKHHPDRE